MSGMLTEATVMVLPSVLMFYSYFTTSQERRPGDRVLEEMKLRLSQPSLVEVGLGLSLAMTRHIQLSMSIAIIIFG